MSQRFPNVIVHRRVDTIYNHPSFEKAKNGDKQAAIKLIQDTINIDKIAVQRGKFKEGEIKKVGATWVVTKAAMDRLYGNKKDITSRIKDAKKKAAKQSTPNKSKAKNAQKEL